MRTRLALLSAVFLMFGTPVAADPFVLRPPSALDLDFEGNGFGFFADGFTARQDFNQTFGLSFVPSSPGCDPCNTGQAYNPSFTVANTSMGTGSATVEGANFSGLSFYGDLSFDVTPYVFAPTTADGLRLSTPFTFTGTLRGFTGDDLAFSAALTGGGFASRFFDRGEDGRFWAGENRLTYFFTEAAAPTPEPASLLLLATGIAGLAARKRLMRASPSR